MSYTNKEMRIKLNGNKIESIVGQKLVSLYKGYRWWVEANVTQGIVVVKNLTLHGDYGFVIKLEDLVHDINLVSVMRAGGELLERCGLPTTFMPEDFPELVKKDVKGNVIGDTYAKA